MYWEKIHEVPVAAGDHTLSFDFVGPVSDPIYVMAVEGRHFDSADVYIEGSCSLHLSIDGQTSFTLREARLFHGALRWQGFKLPLHSPISVRARFPYCDIGDDLQLLVLLARRGEVF